MRKLFSCYSEGSSDVPCLRLRPIFLLKASWTIKENTRLNRFFSDPSPSWNPTRFCIHIKPICFVRLKLAVSLMKHFSALTLGITEAGLHPQNLDQLPLRRVFWFGGFYVVFSLACLKVKMITPFLTTFPFTPPELQLLQLVGRKEVLEKLSKNVFSSM